MVQIPETTARVVEAMEKQVACGRCGCVYSYAMQREAMGTALDASASGEKAAVARARRKAKRKLEREDDPVACPECGYFQPNMTRTVRRYYLSWMRPAAFWAIPLGLLAGVMMKAVVHTWVEDPLISRRLWSLSNGVMVAGLVAVPALLGLRFILSRFVDLNAAGNGIERWARGTAPGRVVRSGSRKQSGSGARLPRGS